MDDTTPNAVDPMGTPTPGDGGKSMGDDPMTPATDQSPVAPPVGPGPSSTPTPPVVPNDAAGGGKATPQVVDSSSVAKWDESQRHIEILEKKLGSRVIVIYINLNNMLTEEEVDYLYDHIKTIGTQPKISLLMFGPGGHGIAAARIIYLLRKYYKQIDVIVPSNAASAMTMLALGADRILMGPLSALSPIDTSLGSHPLAPKDSKGYPVRIEINQLQKFIELLNSGMTSKSVEDIKKSPYALLTEHVHPIVIGTIQRMLSLSKMLTSDILRTHMNDEGRITYIVDQLNDAFPTHGYPITYDKAVTLKIQAEMMDEDLNTMSLKFLKVLHALSNGGESEREGTKVKFSRPSIIESTGLRSYYYSERKFVLDQNKAWASTGGTGKYIVVAPRKDERGIVRIKSVDSSELW